MVWAACPEFDRKYIPCCCHFWCVNCLGQCHPPPKSALVKYDTTSIMISCPAVFLLSLRRFIIHRPTDVSWWWGRLTYPNIFETTPMAGDLDSPTAEELEVQRDTNVARLQQTTIYNFFHKWLDWNCRTWMIDCNCMSLWEVTAMMTMMTMPLIQVGCCCGWWWQHRFWWSEVCVKTRIIAFVLHLFVGVVLPHLFHVTTLYLGCEMMWTMAWPRCHSHHVPSNSGHWSFQQKARITLTQVQQNCVCNVQSKTSFFCSYGHLSWWWGMIRNMLVQSIYPKPHTTWLNVWAFLPESVCAARLSSFPWMYHWFHS